MAFQCDTMNNTIIYTWDVHSNLLVIAIPAHCWLVPAYCCFASCSLLFVAYISVATHTVILIELTFGRTKC